MERIEIRCISDEHDMLTVDSYGCTASLVRFEANGCVYAGAEDVRKVRDALTAALDEHDAKQREQRAPWEAARKEVRFRDEDGDRLIVSGWGNDAAFLKCSSREGFVADWDTVDAVIAKLTALRDAHNESNSTKEAQ